MLNFHLTKCSFGTIIGLLASSFKYLHLLNLGLDNSKVISHVRLSLFLLLQYQFKCQRLAVCLESSFKCLSLEADFISVVEKTNLKDMYQYKSSGSFYKAVQCDFANAAPTSEFSEDDWPASRTHVGVVCLRERGLQITF